MASIIKVDTIQSTTANVFFQNSAGTEYARFDADGDLGVGTTSPGVKLDVAGTTNIRHTYTGASGGILFGQYNTTGDAQIQNQSSGGIIALATNNTERMRITSAGSVGIGTTNPLAKLNVVDNTYSCNMYIGYSGGGGTNYLQSNVATYFTNSSGSAQQAAINPYGIGVGTAVPTSGFGIAFPATQSASSDANTLDDYEEGTWTPSVTGSTSGGPFTFGTSQAYYTKIGREVKLSMFMAHNSTVTFSGAYKIGNFPFPTANYGGGGFVSYVSSWISNSPVMFQIEASTTYGYLRMKTSANPETMFDLNSGLIQNNTSYMLTILYMTTT